MRVSLYIYTVFLGLVLAAPAAPAGEVTSDVPVAPDATAKYLFYMHGGYPEQRGGNADYRYAAILDALAAKGFVVIGELRGRTRPRDYAQKVAGQVQKLLSSGVPAANVTVAGHSKGGFMTMAVAAELGNPDLKFGVMAACGKPGTDFERGYRRFVKGGAPNMKGRFLVAWAGDDDVAGD